MDRYRGLFLSVALVLACTSAIIAAEEPKKQPGFAEAVVEKAISLMPAEQKTKLTAVQKEIIAGMKPSATAGKTPDEPYYFVDKEKGSGSSELAEQFRLVRKGVGEKAEYAKLAPTLGRLAAGVIALCQPYHTDEAAFKGTAHAAFEKQLDASVASLKADLDKFDKVDNPTEFALRIAKDANKLLKKLDATESGDPAAVRSAVFALAVNSVADCWHTLLVPQGSTASGEYIGNKRSLKFHLSTCRYLPAEKNRVYFKTRDEAVKEGYVPCKVCKP